MRSGLLRAGKPVLLVALSAAVLVSGCGPSRDTPPTGDEALTGLKAYWEQDIPKLSRVLNVDFAGYLTPVSAHVEGEGVTQDTYIGRTYVVQMSFGYQARGSFSYRCDPDVATHIHISTSSRNAYPSIARPGDIVACSGPVVFSQAKEGWIMYFGVPGMGSAFFVRHY